MQPPTRSLCQQPTPSQLPPQFVADAVTENGGAGDRADEDTRIEQPLFRKEAPHQHEALTRHDQAQQHLALKRHDKKNNQVSPVTEVADTRYQIIEHDPASTRVGPWLA